MASSTYLLAKGAVLADFEDSLVLVCGSSVVRFRENQELARTLFDFLDSPRTVEEVAARVPALNDPGPLLGSLTAAGVLSRSSGVLGEIAELRELAGETPALHFDLPETLNAQLARTLQDFPTLAEASPATDSPTVVVRQNIPTMIKRSRELFEAGICHLPLVPFDGARLIVGPAVVPKLTACFECLVIRKAALTDWPDEYLRFHRGSPVGELAADDAGLGLNLAIRLALAAFYQQSSELIGACTIFDPKSLTMYSSRVWSVPRCPTCSKNGKLSTSYPWLSPARSEPA
ncbi:hypothetical protein [Psychromicrobium lacuslunae]|uniref:Uncharacterized protein n=1 Tax=Psychromicrobium lacuslunae TaxID=1618207 RepID=A0A0D4BZP2_9MICC|nr:hypothetical protein [Psychromicrobium lacuslunae]AJT41784.1 hypothetical protein UM93_10110 [Psychromicrobium lacuslunae]